VEEEGRLAEDLLGKAGSLGDSGPQASPAPGRPFPKPFQPYEEDGLPAEGAAGRPPRKNTAADPATQRPPEVVGAIQMVSVENVAGAEGDKKKDNAVETVYLPPSFVAAHLLSGVDAPVLNQGTANPIPMLLRLKDLAVLPNRVKADLKGCFVIAGGTGSLATERVDARLITLSCVSKGGDSVIDTPVKGYLVDVDGKQGLQGKVVAKMGSMLARSMVAGILSGAGDYLESTTTTTMVSPIGVTETPTFEPDTMARGAIGKGLSQATRQLQDFYMDLARETFPVIEIGSGRDVTVVVSEGVEMQIKPYVGVRDCENCRPTVLAR
jgi:conjugal transfer pilus assembly protein TraB